MQNLATLAALAFAAYRITQLVVWDSIGDPVRTRIELWHAARHTSFVRGFVRDLLSCVYCVGFWISLTVVGLYLVASGNWGCVSPWVHGIEVWAVAGGQALLNRFDDTRKGE